MQIKIRTMDTEDITFALNLTKSENWWFTKNDFIRLLDFEPNGCFIAEKNGASRVGIVTTLSYGKFAWLGVLIVDPNYRSKGIGTMLTEHAFSYLKEVGAETIKTDAVPKAVSLFERLECKKECKVLRLYSKGKALEGKKERDIRGLKAIDIEKLITFDEDYSGVSRAKVLKRLIMDFPELCLVEYENKNKLIGYMMIRKYEEGYRIGPWICDPSNSDIAERLLRDALHTIDGAPTKINVLETNNVAIKILKTHGFEEISEFVRMYYGTYKPFNTSNALFAAGGPDKG